MRNPNVYWIGSEQGLKWARQELVSVNVINLKNSEELALLYSEEKNNLTKNYYIIFDIEQPSQIIIEHYAKKMSDAKNFKLIFLFNESETPHITNVKLLLNVYFMHRYDSFALRGCIIDLVSDATMFLRQEERRHVNRIIKLKRTWESDWHDVHLRDTSKSGMGVIAGLSDYRFLRVKDRIIIQVSDHVGMVIYFLAEVKRVMNNSTCLTAGLKILKPLASHSETA